MLEHNHVRDAKLISLKHNQETVLYFYAPIGSGYDCKVMYNFLFAYEQVPANDDNQNHFYNCHILQLLSVNLWILVFILLFESSVVKW